MPSFDIVSELNMSEVINAVIQANKEIATRYDFKGSGAKYEQDKAEIMMHCQNDTQLNQMLEILQSKLFRRGVDILCMENGSPELTLKNAKQKIILKEGIETELGKKIVKIIKDAGLKVQASIQDKKLRVTGKKKDDLQEVIALMRQTKLEMPLQYNNFRD